jgi:ubiquinone/menaquinone biosynthesis C-methylase UbiE
MREQDAYQLSGSGPENYERHQVSSLFGPLAERFLKVVSLRSGDRVLDVACGTGIVARLAAPQVGETGQVTGVDINPGMLEVARAHTPTSGAPVEWRHGDAEALPCDDASYHVVLCQQGLQFVANPAQALREMHRVLIPGGRVAICSWSRIEHNPWNLAVSAGLARYLSDEAAARVRAPFALGEAEYLQTLMTEAGFRDVEIEVETLHRHLAAPEESIPGYIASTPNAQAVADLADDVRAALIGEISEALRAYRQSDGMLVPSETHIALARK